VPPGEWIKFKPDEEFLEDVPKSEYCYMANIPPAWITGYSERHPPVWSAFKSMHDAMRGDVYYVAMIVSAKKDVGDAATTQEDRDTSYTLPALVDPSGDDDESEHYEENPIDVGVITAGDDLVCESCEDIAANGPYDIDEAEDLIPAPVSGRCAFFPWDDKRYAHDAFNPEEERDYHGRWGAGGAAGEADKVVLDPKVIAVGGDAWNMATARRLERQYQTSKPALEKIASEAVGKEVTAIELFSSVLYSLNVLAS
jgi:hypothetical protein